MADQLLNKYSSTDDFNENLSKNLSLIMKENNVSESDLARALNLPYNTIHRLVSGHTTDPRISTLKSIASYFNVSLDTLLNQNQGVPNTLKTHIGPRTVPIVTWEQLSDDELLRTINSLNWDHWLPISLVSIDNLSLNAYALESRPSMQPRFPIGTFFIIDPDCKPIDGDLILVKIKINNAVSLRELIIDPPSIQLLPIIENSDVLNFNESEHEIIGVVVLSMHHCRRS
ncbi:LexA family protein [Legionella longbeachae]|nr:helix-turn-helix domain-containing protein [Legionella longbeachae]